MVVLDSKNSSLINGILYFDDVSVKLYSTKVLSILTPSNTINVEITKNNVFGAFSYNSGTLNMVNKGKLFSNTSTTMVGSNYLHIVNLYAVSEKEGQYTDTIILSDGQFTKEITVQCETIDEEDRFAVALSNNKFYINDKFINAFRESDINEHYTDFKLLNEKRRELLLDLFSIKSFVGVYYGLINALKYFGYDDDVIIKEFWTYFDNSLNEYVLSRHNIETDVSKLPKSYTKTNMFNITYKFNDITGNYGSDDLPELMDVFFNDYEALVKMNNLKIILETYFLPAHAIIVEIVGEHTNFYKSGIGYYIHQAMIHYYTTEIKGVYDSEIYKYHESRQTELYYTPKTAVVFGEYALRLRKIYPNHSSENIENNFNFYEDNFAYVKLDFNQQFYDYMTTVKIVVVDSKNREVLTIENEDFDDVILIGFLRDDKYNIKTICTDKYNLIHVFELKFETEFINHNFEVFTVKNELNFTEPEKKNTFKTCKEAFEYFKWFDQSKDFNQERSEIEYSGLPILHAYDSFFGSTGMQDFWKYKDGQFPLLRDMLLNLKPYRFVTDNMAKVNGFDINNEKHENVPKELYKSLNKAYLMVFHELVDGSNIIQGNINGEQGYYSFFVNDSAIGTLKENSIVTGFYNSQQNPNNVLGVFNDFDCYVYYIMDSETMQAKQYCVLISRNPYDIANDKFSFPNFQFKNLISHSGAFTYVNILANSFITQPLEIVADGVTYYRNLDNMITDVNSFVDEVKKLFEQYEALSNFEIIALDNTSVFINGDKTFVLNNREIGRFGGSVRNHIVNDLIKIDSGTDIMQYSIVFAKIDETAKTRPYDITWRLYENSGNDKNLIETSNDYFFSTILLDRSSYSLELEYYNKPNIREGDIESVESFKRVVKKEGVFLTKNNYFDTHYKKFVLSQYENR